MSTESLATLLPSAASDFRAPVRRAAARRLPVFGRCKYDGVQSTQDFILERYRSPGDPHQGQDEPGSDAKKPVQLEQGFLQHV